MTREQTAELRWQFQINRATISTRTWWCVKRVLRQEILSRPNDATTDAIKYGRWRGASLSLVSGMTDRQLLLGGFNL